LLFHRSKRKVEITPAGQQFLIDARAILADMDHAALRAREAAAGQTGLLRIGLNYSAPINPLLSSIFRRFVRLYPQVGIELHENTSAKQLDGLYHRTLDLCFIWPTRDDASPDTAIHELSREHPIARKKKLNAADLRDQTIFLPRRQTRTAFYDALLASCRKAGFHPDIRTDLNQLPFIMNIAAVRQGIAFIPEFFRRIRPEGAVFRDCSFLPPSVCRLPLALASRRHDASPLVKNFIEVAKGVRKKG
jgi:DNA-binding transcriptional LysR family regulator